jgi:hypothetical protein
MLIWCLAGRKKRAGQGPPLQGLKVENKKEPCYLAAAFALMPLKATVRRDL